jgi:type IV pilus assembly protein PilQ
MRFELLIEEMGDRIMMAKRLVVSLVLLALVSNFNVFGGTGTRIMSAAEGQAFTLVALKHETAGALTRILIESSSPPLYAVFRPTERLVVIDLPGGDGSQLASEYAIKSALVDSVTVQRSRISAGSPGSTRAVTRLEIGVRSDARDRSVLQGNTLVFEVSPASATYNAADVKSDTKDSAKEAKRASQKSADSGVYVYPAPVATQPAAPAVESAKPAAQGGNLKPATMIRAVRSEALQDAVRIVVDTDGLAQYKDFVLPNPWRVVVDITGVRSAVGNATNNVNSTLVDRVRVGAPSANTVRIVIDAKSKVPYRVDREGSSLVITVGNPSTTQNETVKPADSKPLISSSSVPPAREVKVAGERIENKSESAANDGDSNLIAQARGPAGAGGQGGRQPQVSAQPNTNLPLPSTKEPSKPAVTTGQPAPQPAAGGNRSTFDVGRPGASPALQPRAQSQRNRAEMAFCDPEYVGGLISFDLRAGVDLRDMLRFISQQYNVNFIVDRSVSAVPVDLKLNDVPWNQVMESVLRANRLGAVCEGNGRIIRIATLAAVKEEEDARRAIQEAQDKQVPLVTKIIHLKYARALGLLGNSGGGQSGRGGGGGGGASGGASGQGSLMSIVTSRLSSRGRTEIDARTNSLIITDLPEYCQVIEEMVAKLDKPEAQVEIEARIIVANRNFLRDLGVEMASGVIGSSGQAGVFSTSPATFNGRGLTPGGGTGGGSGSGSGSGSGTGSGSGSGGGTSGSPSLGPNLIGPLADTSLRASAVNSVLALTTGALGTGILSMAVSASESKGQVRTIASPRVTTTDNKTAEIVNGVQIPVQTVSNNTITTTFVTAALRLEITPQIIEENGQVLMHVVAENNTVNFSLANQFNNGTPGINTQSAESTVLVGDGGTTVMGGINIDSEGHTINRTPGVSHIPVLGELFKRRTVRRNTDEVLFFITPRIVHGDGLVGPRAPQRSSLEGSPAGPQRAAITAVPTSQLATQKAPAAQKPAASQTTSQPTSQPASPKTTTSAPASTSGKGGN